MLTEWLRRFRHHLRPGFRVRPLRLLPVASERAGHLRHASRGAAVGARIALGLMGWPARDVPIARLLAVGAGIGLGLTGTIPAALTPALLEVLGRVEVTGGQIAGTINVERPAYAKTVWTARGLGRRGVRDSRWPENSA